MPANSNAETKHCRVTARGRWLLRDARLKQVSSRAIDNLRELNLKVGCLPYPVCEATVYTAFHLRPYMPDSTRLRESSFLPMESPRLSPEQPSANCHNYHCRQSPIVPPTDTLNPRYFPLLEICYAKFLLAARLRPIGYHSSYREPGAGEAGVAVSPPRAAQCFRQCGWANGRAGQDDSDLQRGRRSGTGGSRNVLERAA